MVGKLTEMTNIMSETVNALSMMQKSIESMHIKNLKTNDSIREQTKAYAHLQKQLLEHEQLKNASIRTTKTEQELAKKNVLQIIHEGKVIKDLNKVGKKKRRVLRKSTKQTKKYTEATKKSKEELEGYSDQFSHLRHQILNVHTVTKDMEKTFLAGISESKGWTAFSRFVSGTGLWKAQNKLRGIIDVMRIVEKAKIANIEKIQKETQALDNLANAEKELSDQKSLFNKLASEGNDAELEHQFATYALMLKKGVAQEDAIKLMKLEFKELEGINKANEKRGFGGVFAKAAERKKASRKLAKAEYKDILTVEKFKGEKGGKEELEFYQQQRKETKLIGEEDEGTWDERRRDIESGEKEPKEAMGKMIMAFSKRYKKRETLKQKFLKRAMALRIGMNKFVLKLKKQLLPKLFMFLKGALGMLVWVFLLITGLFIVFKIVKGVWDSIAEFRKSGGEAFQKLQAQFAAFKDALSNVWGAAVELWEAFRSGDLFDFIDKLLAFGLTLWELAKETFWLIVAAVPPILGILMDKLTTWLSKPEHVVKLMKALAVLLLYMTVKWGILWLVNAFAAHLAALSAFGVMLAGILALVLVGAVSAIVYGIGKYFKFFAGGGVSTGGMAVVGEEGPELVNLPKGARVHSNTDSRKMLSQSDNKVINNNVTVNVQGRIGASDREVRDIAEKVGRIISTKMSRTTTTI